MPRKHIEVPALSAEFSDADLGDVRLNRRLGLLADRLGERPGESFPKALDDAELEAAYRFFGNDGVSPEAILAPHFRQTARRAAKHGRVLVIHDTTQFEFSGNSKREGLGRLIHPGQGFFGHFSLVATADGARYRSASLRWRLSFVSTRRSVTRIGRRARAEVRGPAGSTASTMLRRYLAARRERFTSWTERLIPMRFSRRSSSDSVRS